jgi:hypothetical protein
MKTLRSHVIENANAGARKKRGRDREPAGEDELVRMVRSLGLDAAVVALPSGIDLEERAARMNEFWRALVRLQYQDVIVVAVCANGERKRR